RTTPDRRDAHLMRIFARAEMDLADRASGAGTLRHRGGRDTVEQNDLPGNIAREVCRCAHARGDGCSARSFRRRRARERLRDAGETLTGNLDMSRARQADIGVMQYQLGLVAVGVERRLDVIETYELGWCSRMLGPARKFSQMGHQTS